MTERALLQVSHPDLMLQRVGGLSVLERQLWTMHRAGLKQVWIGAARPADFARLRLPPGLGIIWSKSPVAAELDCDPPYLALSGDHFLRVETLRYIAQADYPAPVALEDTSGTSVVQVLPSRQERAGSAQRQQLPPGTTCRLERPVATSPALPWLLALGIKSQDGFMARNFDRSLSLAVSRLLLDSFVTPNMMTVASSLIGLCGAAFFLVPTHSMRLSGALLVWLHSVLDGCDGELARIRFQESPLGADLDFWGDNIVHLALFGCLAWGFYKADQSVLPLALGVASAVGTLGSAILNYRERLERRRHPTAKAARAYGIVPALTRIQHILAARDFIYLLVLLAFLDRLYEFMWATAVGSLLFFFMMVYLGRKHDEQANQPHPPREGEAGDSASGHGRGQQHLHSRS